MPTFNELANSRVKARQLMGDILPGHVVHHKDGNPMNNDLDNLQIVSKQEHRKLHRKDQGLKTVKPDKTDGINTVNIRQMPSDLWWDLRVLAAERRISVQDLVIEVLREYLKTA